MDIADTDTFDGLIWDGVISVHVEPFHSSTRRSAGFMLSAGSLSAGSIKLKVALRVEPEVL